MTRVREMYTSSGRYVYDDQSRSWVPSGDSPTAFDPTGGQRGLYRLGRLDRTTQSYQPASVSGDLAVQESGDLMHRRLRDQVRNNPHLKRMRVALQDLIVGCEVQTLADPFEPWMDLTGMTPDDLDERLSYALESDELYSEWFNDPKKFDAAGKLDGPAFQRMVIGECVEAGACFVIESMRPDAQRDEVPLCYQIIERDQVDRTKNWQFRTNEFGQTTRAIDGVEIDELGREVAFWLYVSHPGDSWGTSMQSRRLTADRCRHVMLKDRPSQHIGATWLHAAAQPEIDRDKFLTAELSAAAKAATIALIHKKKNPHSGRMGIFVENGDESDGQGNQQVRLGTSPVAMVIGETEDVKTLESNHPNSDASGFLKVIDRYSAQGAGLSYYTLTGDYESTNFSSVRAAKLDEDGHIRPLQHWLGVQLALPIRRRFNLMAGAMGMFSTVASGEFLRGLRRYQRFDAMGPGRDLLDPDSETNAAISRLRAGLSTLRIECSKRGLHWVRVLRQIKLENQLAGMLGIVLDFSKGQGGQVTDTTRSKGAANAS